MTLLVPRARRASRVVALATVALGTVASRGGARAQQALVLAALSIGMPHGAADTELLRSAARGRRGRHAGLLLGYTATAAAATAVVRRGGRGVDAAVLLASAAHFAEGELACWPASGSRRRSALRLLAAALTTVALPAAVGTANRRPAEVGATGAAAAGPSSAAGAAQGPRAVGDRSGLALLADPRARRTVGPLAAAAVLSVAALAADRDRQAAADSALLLVLPLVATPAPAFAAYFGGWHALRHTARVVDALVEQGQLEPQRSLPQAFTTLGRRSAWAAVVGLVGAGVLAARDPEHASDNAFAAVLGLTVPHMATVTMELARRR